MRKLILVIIIVLLVWNIPYFTAFGKLFRSSGGMYFGHGIIWCNSEEDCAHERGHWEDEKHGYISQTAEFAQALDNYINKNNQGKFCSRELWCTLLLFPGINGNPMRPTSWGEWGGYQEAYATIYSKYEMGLVDLPEELAEYYVND